MRFDDRLYADDGSQGVWADAQARANANGAPVAVLSRDGWLAICEDAEVMEEVCNAVYGWAERALVDPMEAL